MKFLDKLSFGLIAIAVSSFLPQLSYNSLLKNDAIAIAGIVRGYVPPLDRPSIQRTEGSGSRGCDRAKDVRLQLLAPKDHIATTVSEHPTFLWYVSQTSLPVLFTLSEVGSARPVLEKHLTATKTGIIELKIPSTAPKLQENRQYKWTVSVVCNSKHPSENIRAQAILNRKAIPPALKQKIQHNRSLQKAQAYARNGIWYDAIANFYGLYIVDPQNEENKISFFNLLNQADIPPNIVEQD